MDCSFRFVFHDSEYPSTDERDEIDELKNAGWKWIAYGRKYDGITFELGFITRQVTNRFVSSPEFKELMNARYRDSGRKNVEYCSILVENRA